MTPERKNMLRGVALALVVGVAVYFIAMDLTGGARHSRGIVGMPAPSFTLPSARGDGAVKLEDLQGKGVILTFWATYCDACKRELPSLERVYRELAGDDLAVLTISADPAPTLGAFLGRAGFTLPVLADPGRVHYEYDVQGIPRTLLIGPDGVVLYDVVGPLSQAQLLDAARHLAACARSAREGGTADAWCAGPS